MDLTRRLTALARRPRAPRAAVDRRASTVGATAQGFAGVDVNGDTVELTIGPGRLGIVFLTTSCEPCLELWGSASGDLPVHLVTPSPETESRRKVARLAPAGVSVIMSSDGWHAYRVGRAPWLVVVGDGLVAFDGPAPGSWDALGQLVRGR